MNSVLNEYFKKTNGLLKDLKYHRKYYAKDRIHVQIFENYIDRFESLVKDEHKKIFSLERSRKLNDSQIIGSFSRISKLYIKINTRVGKIFSAISKMNHFRCLMEKDQIFFKRFTNVLFNTARNLKNTELMDFVRNLQFEFNAVIDRVNSDNEKILIDAIKKEQNRIEGLRFGSHLEIGKRFLESHNHVQYIKKFNELLIIIQTEFKRRQIMIPSARNGEWYHKFTQIVLEFVDEMHDAADSIIPCSRPEDFTHLTVSEEVSKYCNVLKLYKDAFVKYIGELHTELLKNYHGNENIENLTKSYLNKVFKYRKQYQEDMGLIASYILKMVYPENYNIIISRNSNVLQRVNAQLSKLELPGIFVNSPPKIIAPTRSSSASASTAATQNPIKSANTRTRKRSLSRTRNQRNGPGSGSGSDTKVTKRKKTRK